MVLASISMLQWQCSNDYILYTQQNQGDAVVLVLFFPISKSNSFSFRVVWSPLFFFFFVTMPRSLTRRRLCLSFFCQDDDVKAPNVLVFLFPLQPTDRQTDRQIYTCSTASLYTRSSFCFLLSFFLSFSLRPSVASVCDYVYIPPIDR